MTARAKVLQLIDYVPDAEIPILLEVVKRFAYDSIDDIATPDDINACEQAMREYTAGQTISHNDIDWD